MPFQPSLACFACPPRHAGIAYALGDPAAGLEPEAAVAWTGVRSVRSGRRYPAPTFPAPRQGCGQSRRWEPVMRPASRSPEPHGGDTIRRNTAFALASQLATASFTAILTIYPGPGAGRRGLRDLRAGAERRIAGLPAGGLRDLAVHGPLRRGAPRRGLAHRGGAVGRPEAEADLVGRAVRAAVRGRGADLQRLRHARDDVAAARSRARGVRPEHRRVLPHELRGARASVADTAPDLGRKRGRGGRQHRPRAGRRRCHGGGLRPCGRLPVRHASSRSC